MTTATQNRTVERYRKMVEIIENCQPDEAYRILSAPAMQFTGLTPYYEEAISKSAEYSFAYARDVINGRWKPGELAI